MPGMITGDKKISYYKYGEYDAGDAICCHKGQVDPAKVIGFDQDMLVDEHAHKNRDTHPVEQSETTIETGGYHTNGSKQVEEFGDVQGLGLSQPGRHGIKILPAI